MYTFSASSQLKAWMGRIAQPGKPSSTYQRALQVLLQGKKF
ncbi:NAD(P)H-dependent oxidoreductase [Klebsiella michiganensis]|nr:NAD(P)H-dependent oxidoreductase [Klebsiella michiganensis]